MENDAEAKFGNIAVLTGKSGKLLIDSGFEVSKLHLTEALGRLSSDPITQLINTHWHPDHTDGNAWVHTAGATITAHTATKGISLAIDLPLKVLAWEDKSEKVWVSYNSPAYLQERHDVPDELMQNIVLVETLAAMTAE